MHTGTHVLSVVPDVEVAGLDLTDRSSKAAFALASAIQGNQEVDSPNAGAGKAQDAKTGVEAQTRRTRVCLGGVVGGAAKGPQVFV